MLSLGLLRNAQNHPMSLKTSLIATAAWTVLMLVISVGAIVYVGTRPVPNRVKNERASQLGGGLGVFTAIGYGAIWLPFAAKIGKQRREQRTKASRKKKKTQG
jgi:hypothetical protein